MMCSTIATTTFNNESVIVVRVVLRWEVGTYTCGVLVLACFAAARKLASNLYCDRVLCFLSIYLLIIFVMNLLGQCEPLYRILILFVCIIFLLAW